MKSAITLNWLDDMSFETEVNGHKLVLDAAENVGGKDRGPRPKPLMLVSLAGCTAMFVHACRWTNSKRPLTCRRKDIVASVTP